MSNNSTIIYIGIIPSKFIANVVADGRFSAANINNTTQVVMMDEWTENSLSCEDAKRVLQGEHFFNVNIKLNYFTPLNYNKIYS